MKAFAALTSIWLISAAAPSSLPNVSDEVCGDYVKVRTASVFAGACHYNGELVTTGRDAVMAWCFTSGSWRGVDLSGLRVMAAVGAEQNLGLESQLTATRKAELIIDADATDA